jgi:hypothetical protein
MFINFCHSGLQTYFFVKYSKPSLIFINWVEVVQISGAKGGPKRKEKKVEQMHGKFNDISSANENK